MGVFQICSRILFVRIFCGLCQIVANASSPGRSSQSTITTKVAQNLQTLLKTVPFLPSHYVPCVSVLPRTRSISFGRALNEERMCRLPASRAATAATSMQLSMHCFRTEARSRKGARLSFCQHGLRQHVLRAIHADACEFRQRVAGKHAYHAEIVDALARLWPRRDWPV